MSFKLTSINGELVEVNVPILQIREATVLDTDDGQLLVKESVTEVTDAILRDKVGL